MSEEFIFEAAFGLKSARAATKLNEAIELIELQEIEQARSILDSPCLLIAEKQIERLTSPYSNYKDGDDIIAIGAEMYDACISDMNVFIDQYSLTGKIVIEGQDHDADELCSAIVLLLIAVDATTITAYGSSPSWSAQWHSSSPNGKILMEFESGG